MALIVAQPFLGVSRTAREACASFCPLTSIGPTMAKKSKDVYGADGQSDLLTFDPAKLTLVIDESAPSTTSARICP